MASLRRLLESLDRWDWFALLAATPLLLFPTPARTPAMLLVVAPWLARAASGRPPLARTPLNRALLLLSVMMLVSVGATYDLNQSLPKLAGLVLGLGLFYVVARIATPRGWAMALAVLLGASLGLVGSSLIGTQWPAKLARLSSVTARLPLLVRGLPGAVDGFDPNQVAGTLLWVVPLAWALTLHAWLHGPWIRDYYGKSLRRAWRMLTSLAAVLTTLALVLSQSRSAAAGLALTLLAASALVFLRRFGRRVWAPVALAAVVLVTLAAYGMRVAATPALSISAVASATGGLDTLSSRLELWSRSIDTIRAFPFTGVGMNTARVVIPRLFPLFLVPRDFDISHAHNELLQAALDLGLPGLVALLTIYVVAAGMVWQIAAVRGPATQAAWPPALRVWVALGLGGGLLAHFLFGLTDAVALGAKTGLFFWYVLGLVASLYRQATATEPAPDGAVQGSSKPVPTAMGTWPPIGKPARADWPEQV